LTKAASRIYVVDDDPSAQEFLDSETVELGALAIFDVRMPGISGLELQKFIELREACCLGNK
jgi:FixJ family two-component response regulator